MNYEVRQLGSVWESWLDTAARSLGLGLDLDRNADLLGYGRPDVYVLTWRFDGDDKSVTRYPARCDRGMAFLADGATLMVRRNQTPGGRERGGRPPSS